MIRMAMTIGAERMSVFTNNKSSTAWRLPGDASAYHSVQVQNQKWTGGVHTSLSSLNFVAFFDWPASGTQISTFSCRAVNASLKKDFA